MAEKRDTSTNSINEEEEEIDKYQKKKYKFQRASYKANKRMKEKFSSSSKVKEPVIKDSDPSSPEEHYLSPPPPITTWEEWSKENSSGNPSSTQVKNLPPVNPPSGKEPIKGHTPQYTPLEVSTATTKIMTQNEVKG